MFEVEFDKRLRSASQGNRLNEDGQEGLRGSPSRRRIKVGYGDRFIPSRDGIDLQASFNLADNSSEISKAKRKTGNEVDAQRLEESNKIFLHLLRFELFGSTILNSFSNLPSSDLFVGSRTPPPQKTPINRPVTPSTPPRNLFSYISPQNRTPTSGTRTSGSGGRNCIDDPTREIYSLSPVRFDSQRLLLSPRKQPRAIPKVPFKVLDAPELHDDFYLNLVDWGCNNILGVGLGTCVYLWSAHSGKVTKLCDLGPNDSVTSVCWIQRGSHVALGTNKGLVHIWDAEQCKRTRTMLGHTSRVGSLAWNEHILTSGGRDHQIFHRDVRVPEHHIKQLSAHKQEVCGLKWNCEDGQLASGGNDNKLIVWDRLNETPLYKFSEHTAAVKAIAWNPHQHGILASGGGTADRTIKFWNTLNGQQISEIDTGSQVCNLAWSKNSNEIVSTHGYSENQVIVWKYPSMSQVAALTGHTYRVLYLAMSPDGQTIVTGAGDETLRFWNVFSKNKNDSDRDSLLDPFTKIR
ncbi:hypothetical protein PNEG_03304 [Pneumocystis murina B123]|uniref:CDC20/Fizzy WD40 domain-containing protein n=1 Tax=Pneumocystis murina (strain B123) TaxID=1069680 RepID=M7NMM4_PNEMU|nr:hypothetical protein PNEG_03304 [Pneumocystis murina B123]EMR08477.1 hypothetical protein PNEG_03304 [Pneumocystis murina B123]